MKSYQKDCYGYKEVYHDGRDLYPDRYFEPLSSFSEYEQFRIREFTRVGIQPVYIMSRSQYLKKYITPRGLLSPAGIDKCYEFNLQDHIIEAPCGKCCGCRIDQQNQWTSRCLLESQLYESSYFITFTYDDEHVPHSPLGMQTLQYKDFQDFLKRLRDSLDYKIRYRVCCEYGERTRRPHYHALIFGLKLSDLKFLYSEVRGRKVYRAGVGHEHYTSKFLEKKWQKGFVDVAAVDVGSIRYVNSYMMKTELFDCSYQDAKNFFDSHILQPEQQQAVLYQSAVKIGEILPPCHHQSSRPAIGLPAFFQLPDLYNTYFYFDHLPSGFKLPVKHLKIFDRYLKNVSSEQFKKRISNRRSVAKAVAYDTSLPISEYLSQREERLRSALRLKHRPL
ncbi:replication initiator protein [Sigmofec virus UA08Rod_6403]|uniref:Replication initiator protein n=1 Tax=Sigmofec virus UA08Rod_6403 TaxID=2929228 RepID=A0A976N0M4_9VIRU|nr:replication initiator protein [Sigmofec virus UA08Rod_6403]